MKINLCTFKVNYDGEGKRAVGAPQEGDITVR